jgi:predicted cobalt transporter CbtA
MGNSHKGGLFMGLVIIFGLVTVLAAIGAFTALKNKNLLGAFWGIASFAVFGWFTVMTVIHSGFPTGTH